MVVYDVKDIVVVTMVETVDTAEMGGGEMEETRSERTSTQRTPWLP